MGEDGRNVPGNRGVDRTIRQKEVLRKGTEVMRKYTKYLYFNEAQELVSKSTGFRLVDKGSHFMITSLHGYVYYERRPYVNYGKGKMINLADLILFLMKSIREIDPFKTGN